MSTQQNDLSPSRLPAYATIFAVGAAGGAGIAWAVLSGWLDGEKFEAVLRWIGIVLLVLIPLTALTTLAGLWLLRRFWNRFEGTLGATIDHGARSLKAAATANPAEAVDHFSAAMREGVAWYAPIAARRFVVQTTLALLVTFGGLVGTALLFRQIGLLQEQNAFLKVQTGLLDQQNKSIKEQTELVDKQTKLLERQNEKTDLQIVTAEAQRRSDLTAEVFGVLRQVEDYANSKSAIRQIPKYCNSRNLIKIDLLPVSVRQNWIKSCKEKLLIIPPILANRIRTLAASATPYYTIEIDVNDDSNWIFKKNSYKLSQQRGQLLVGLAAHRVDFKVLNADFSYSDLRGATLTDASLYSINLSESDLSSSQLSGANFNFANLRGAHLSFSDLSETTILFANMTNSFLNGISFYPHSTIVSIDGQATILSPPQIFYTRLSGASVINSDLSNIILEIGKDGSNILTDGTNINELYKYYIFIDDFNELKNLDKSSLPKNWSIRQRGDNIDKHSISTSGSEDVIIDTPWGDYADLIAEQRSKGYIDLYAREQKRKAQEAAPAPPTEQTPKKPQ